MSRNLIIGLVISMLLHTGFFFGGQILKAHPAPKVAKKETPTIELMPIPPVEPDKPEDVPDNEEKPDISDIVPPMQADMPSLSDSPFTQQIQPPPNPNGKLTGVIAIPTGKPGGSGNGNIFDLASLDQKPEPRFQPSPVYPYELKRAAIQGDVTVGFIVDSSGNTHDPYIVNSTNSGFDKVAMECVLKWRFRPGKKGGSAVNTRMVVPLEFHLNKN
jgi:protein TonB